MINMSNCSYIYVRFTASNKMSFIWEVQVPIISQINESVYDMSQTNKKIKHCSHNFIQKHKLQSHFEASLLSSEACTKLPHLEKKHTCPGYPAVEKFVFTRISSLSYLVN